MHFIKNMPFALSRFYSRIKKSLGIPKG